MSSMAQSEDGPENTTGAGRRIDPETAAALARLSHWSGDAKSLARSVECPTFPAAIDLVDRVAVEAEAMDHHPDIDIRWRTVTFTLSTHTAGGVTDLDITLARIIDRLVEEL